MANYDIIITDNGLAKLTVDNDTFVGFGLSLWASSIGFMSQGSAPNEPIATVLSFMQGPTPQASYAIFDSTNSGGPIADLSYSPGSPGTASLNLGGVKGPATANGTIVLRNATGADMTINPPAGAFGTIALTPLPYTGTMLTYSGSPSNGNVPTWNGSAWTPQAPGAGTLQATLTTGNTSFGLDMVLQNGNSRDIFNFNSAGSLITIGNATDSMSLIVKDAGTAGNGFAVNTGGNFVQVGDSFINYNTTMYGNLTIQGAGALKLYDTGTFGITTIQATSIGNLTFSLPQAPNTNGVFAVYDNAAPPTNGQVLTWTTTGTPRWIPQTPGGGTPTLSAVLTAGNTAGGTSINMTGQNIYGNLITNGSLHLVNDSADAVGGGNYGEVIVSQPDIALFSHTAGGGFNGTNLVLSGGSSKYLNMLVDNSTVFAVNGVSGEIHLSKPPGGGPYAQINATSLTTTRNQFLPDADGEFLVYLGVPTNGDVPVFNGSVWTHVGLPGGGDFLSSGVIPMHGDIELDDTFVPTILRLHWLGAGGVDGFLTHDPLTSISKTWAFPDASGTVALTSNLSSYLPLAGGTMSGDITMGIHNLVSGTDTFGFVTSPTPAWFATTALVSPTVVAYSTGSNPSINMFSGVFGGDPGSGLFLANIANTHTTACILGVEGVVNKTSVLLLNVDPSTMTPVTGRSSQIVMSGIGVSSNYYLTGILTNAGTTADINVTLPAASGTLLAYAPAPTNGQVPIWNSGTGQWVPGAQTGGSPTLTNVLTNGSTAVNLAMTLQYTGGGNLFSATPGSSTVMVGSAANLTVFEVVEASGTALLLQTTPKTLAIGNLTNEYISTFIGDILSKNTNNRTIFGTDASVGQVYVGNATDNSVFEVMESAGDAFFVNNTTKTAAFGNSTNAYTTSFFGNIKIYNSGSLANSTTIHNTSAGTLTFNLPATPAANGVFVVFDNTTPPSAGNVPQWNGTTWVPTTPGLGTYLPLAGGTMAGSVSLNDTYSLTNAVTVGFDNGAVLANPENNAITGSNAVVDSFADTAGDGCAWSYVVKSNTGANLRAGTVVACWDSVGDTYEYKETSTLDIGATTDLSLSVDITGGTTVRLLASRTGGALTWTVKAVRQLM